LRGAGSSGALEPGVEVRLAELLGRRLVDADEDDEAGVLSDRPATAIVLADRRHLPTQPGGHRPGDVGKVPVVPRLLVGGDVGERDSVWEAHGPELRVRRRANLRGDLCSADQHAILDVGLVQLERGDRRVKLRWQRARIEFVGICWRRRIGVDLVEMRVEASLGGVDKAVRFGGR
jgi:hypothetical protein